MTRHRWAIAVESVVLAGPTTAFLLVFGPIAVFTPVEDPSATGFAVSFVVILSAVALLYFWRLAFAFVLMWELPTQGWWCGACIGVALVVGAVLLVASSALGLGYPEFLLPFAFGTYGIPLLIPLLHMWLVRAAVFPGASHT
jgi:hypothetical protein